MKILGISCLYHDSAAVLMVDGEVIAAVQEERFTRKKHDSSFPINSIEWILEKFDLRINQFDCISYYEDPKLKFRRIVYSHSLSWPNSFRDFCKQFSSQDIKINIKKIIREQLGYVGEIFICKHHSSHAASAFFPSPFKEAAILTIDGVGEFESTTLGIGKENNIKQICSLNFPHSLGLLYSSFTYYCGFKINSGEYKLMGLAPYGNAIYQKKIKDKLIDIKSDGSFRLNMKYFGHLMGVSCITQEFIDLFERDRRNPESEISNFYMDIAASIQKVSEEIIIKIAKNLRKKTELPNLCMAGGVALNCVANGRIISEKIFDKIFIQPASGDAGGALGSAYIYYHQQKCKKRKISKFMNPYLGPNFSKNEIKYFLDSRNIPNTFSNNIAEETAKLLEDGKIIGWFQSKAEFGPRALGNRSILGNPLLDNMQKQINLKIKFRESFRPFAPMVIEEEASEWFDLDCSSPYTLLVANINPSKLNKINESDINDKLGFKKLEIKRSSIPSVTHVDNSARIQTVHKSSNKLIYKLLQEFKKLTGCPVLINTSFNVRGEPIVLTPEDAYNCFLNTHIDYLIMDNYIVDKKEIDPNLKLVSNESDLLTNFPLD